MPVEFHLGELIYLYIAFQCQEMTVHRDVVIARLKLLYERNPLARRICLVIKDLARRIDKFKVIKIMDFCGTHEWTITHYGIRSLMPDNVELVAGPGCPICITPAEYVDQLIKLSFEGIHVLTYGDAYRLRGMGVSGVYSLEEARAIGGKVSVVYSFLDAIRVAKENPSENYVFFGVGFETTMPSVASPLIRNAVPKNLTILPAYRLTPPIVKYLIENVPDVEIHGIIAPGHVSSVIGSLAWKFIPDDYGIPTVVAGFEPLDVLIAIMIIIQQLCRGNIKLVNEYIRVVKPEGNVAAKRAMMEVFDVVDAVWRGIGLVPNSGAVLKDKFRDHDACHVYGLKHPRIGRGGELIGCKCSEIVLGKAKPTDCPLFMKKCTPQRPYGPCMVSIEGTCRIWAEHGGLRRIEV